MGLTEIELSVLLDQPAARLRAYPYETVIAEKFQAMVMLGRANSRMKDFYDIRILARSNEFDADRLARAIAATFARRRTEIIPALSRRSSRSWQHSWCRTQPKRETVSYADYKEATAAPCI
jgi:Nucleotidyl transferase AbiEii toxin, Type IV TA system